MHEFFVAVVVVVSVVHVLLEVELAVMFEKSIQQFTDFRGNACILIWMLLCMVASKHNVVVVFLGHYLECFHSIV